jgi:hypothetical protein
MDTFIVVLLAVVGFATIVALSVAGLAALYEGGQNATPDCVDPYREGLDAAARISSAAFEAEQLLYGIAEATKQSADPPANEEA